MNLNRHSDLLNLAEYVAKVFVNFDQRFQVKIITSQRTYDGTTVQHRVVNGLKEVFSVLFEESPDLIYLTGPSRNTLYALILQKILRRKKTVIHLHRFDYNSYSKMRGLFLKIYNWICTKFSDYCVVHSSQAVSFNERYILAALPFYTSNYNNVSNPKDNKLRVLVFGRIDRNKGIDRVFEIASSLPSVKFYIFGEIVDQSLILAVDKIRALSNCQVFSSRVSEKDLGKMFQNKDVVLMPYTDGTQSGIPNLAASYKVPVLSTDFGDVRGVIERNKCGICLDYNLETWRNVLLETEWNEIKRLMSIDYKEIDKGYKKLMGYLYDNRSSSA